MIPTGYSDTCFQFTEAIAEEPDVFVLVGYAISFVAEHHINTMTDTCQFLTTTVG